MTDSVVAWTGRTACALQDALRLTQEAFAEHLGIHLRTVAAWHQQPDITPKAATQQILDTALKRATDAERRRFTQLAGLAPTAESGDNDEAERRLSEDPNVASALEWLDKHTGWTPGTARRRVAARLAAVDLRELQDRGQRRGQVNQRQIADALNAYYAGRKDYGAYRATYDGHAIATSVFTRAEWLDLECALAPETDQLMLSTKPGDLDPNIDELAAENAVNRLAEALTASVRIVDLPLYRLLDIDVRRDRVGGTLGMTTFAHYALTMDLLESELVDALAAGTVIRPGTLPLRDRYLPNTASVVDVAGRLCVGGALALCAVARPASPGRPADYLLLVQERSAACSTQRGGWPSRPRAFTSRWLTTAMTPSSRTHSCARWRRSCSVARKSTAPMGTR